MAKFDFKKSLNGLTKNAKKLTDDVSKSASKSLKEATKAVKEFDAEEAVKKSTNFVGGVADTVRNYDVTNLGNDLKDMATNSGKALANFANDAMQTTKDAKKALQEVIIEKDTDVSVEEALHVIYLLMAIDGDIDPKEEEGYKGIYTDVGLKDDVYTKIVKKCKSIIKEAKAEGDYYEILNEKAVEILKKEKLTDKNISKKLFLWDLVTIGYSDGTYRNEEKKFIRSIARVLEIDKSVLAEMEFACDALMSLNTNNSTNMYYKKELQNRKDIIMQSITALIEDKEA